MLRSLLTLSCLAALGGCAIVIAPDGEMHTHSAWESGVDGDGQVRTEMREYHGAPNLNVSGSVTVTEEIGATPSLSVEADSNLLTKVRTEMVGDTLHIYVDGSYHSNSGIRVKVVTPAVSSVMLNGSGKVAVTGLNGGNLIATNVGSGNIRLQGAVDSFNARVHGSGSVDAAGLSLVRADVELMGSGQLNFGRISGDMLVVTLHGSGELRGSGTVGRLVAKTYGSGNISLSSMTAQNADLASYGSGDISVAVAQAVTASANGSGDINVYGNPTERNISGKRVRISG